MRIGYFALGVLLFLLARPTRLAPFFGLMGYFLWLMGYLAVVARNASQKSRGLRPPRTCTLLSMSPVPT
jgi:hypothetical protein